MADDFFKKEEAQTETKETGVEEVEKIKVGETEFTSTELQDLVEAGAKLKDIETKQGQPIDDVLTSWGRRGEQLGKWKQATGVETPDEFKKPEELKVDLTDDETQKAQVIQEAKKYGLLTQDEAKQMFNDIYQTNRAGEKLLSEVNDVIREAKADGKPVTEPDKLLEFMADPNNPKDPRKAYKLMFEDELEKWKEERLGTLKKKPMVTDTTSTAGGKEFKAPQITRANLSGVLSDYLKSSGDGQ